MPLPQVTGVLSSVDGSLSGFGLPLDEGLLCGGVRALTVSPSPAAARGRVGLSSCGPGPRPQAVGLRAGGAWPQLRPGTRSPPAPGSNPRPHIGRRVLIHCATTRAWRPDFPGAAREAP